MSKHEIALLVADSNHTNLDIIKNTLTSFDDTPYKISSAKSCKEVISMIAGGDVDILLLDHNMKPQKGERILDQICKNNNVGIPVIVIVPEGKEKIGVKTLDKGAYDYLTREELSTVALSRAVRGALKRKELEKDVKESLAKLEKMAIKDGLTGLYNHHHFKGVMANEFKKAKRHNQPLSCIMLDLDHFKNVNDTHGHQFGDAVLVQAADILKRIVRDTDFVARYGGEEFFIILPNTSLNGAYILAERIRVAFANNIFRNADISSSVTTSIGLSSIYDDNVVSHDDLIENADKALYRAKWRGRNNVCTFEESESEEIVRIKEETGRIEDFYERLEKLNDSIKEKCVMSAHSILRDIAGDWDIVNEHSVRVCDYTDRVTKELSMSEEERKVIRRAALVHDIGMAGINLRILKKSGKLTKREYNLVKRHSNIGVKIMERTKLFERELPLILYHHERFDGMGYPHKLKGDTIPFGARIIAIAEAYDTMVSRNAYNKPRSAKEAVQELKNAAGSQFDPHLVKAFIKAVDKRPLA